MMKPRIVDGICRMVAFCLGLNRKTNNSPSDSPGGSPNKARWDNYENQNDLR